MFLLSIFIRPDWRRWASFNSCIKGDITHITVGTGETEQIGATESSLIDF